MTLYMERGGISICIRLKSRSTTMKLPNSSSGSKSASFQAVNVAGVNGTVGTRPKLRLALDAASDLRLSADCAGVLSSFELSA